MQEVLSVAMNFQKQGKFYQSDLGVYYYKDPLIFGFMVQGNSFCNFTGRRDAVIGLLGIKTNSLSIGYSYDFTISNLIGSSGGAHEISLIYEFNNLSIGAARKRIRAIPMS